MYRFSLPFPLGCANRVEKQWCTKLLVSMIAFNGLLVTPAIAAPAPTPEIIYYQFNEADTTVANHASNPPVNASSATLMGGLTQGALITGTNLKAVVGSGNSSNTDYVNTGWVTSLNGSWSISFFSSEVVQSTQTQYIMGDLNAGQFRIFTGGVAGAGNWILRGDLTDVYMNGGAVQTAKMNTFVYDSVNHEIRAYLNGVLVSTVSQAPSLAISGTGPFKVAGYASNAGLSVGGKMGDVRIYSRALSSSEITDIYNAAFTVPQTLSFGVAPNVAVNTSASVVATSEAPNSGNPITYSTTSTDCTVTSDGVVTGVHAGTDNCLVKASQAGLETPLPGYQEGTVTQLLSIAKGTQTLSFTSVPPSSVSVGDTYSVVATGGASGEGITFSIDSSSSSICSITNTTVTFAAAGTCVINANQTGSVDYEAAAQVQQTVDVDKITQIITFTSVAPTDAKAGDTYTPTATGGASGNPVIFSVAGVTKALSAPTVKAAADVCTINSGVVTFGAPGTCTITATQAGDSSYAGAPAVTQVVTIGSAAIGVPAPVPTLHHAALVLLSLLAGVFGLARLQRRN